MNLAQCGEFLFVWDDARLQLLAIAVGCDEHRRLADRIALVAPVDSLPSRVIPLPHVWGVPEASDDAPRREKSVQKSVSVAIAASHGKLRRVSHFLWVLCICHMSTQAFVAVLDTQTLSWCRNAFGRDEGETLCLPFSCSCTRPCLCIMPGARADELHDDRAQLRSTALAIAGYEQQTLACWAVSGLGVEALRSNGEDAVPYVPISKKLFLTSCAAHEGLALQLLPIGQREFVVVADHWHCYVVSMDRGCCVPLLISFSKGSRDRMMMPPPGKSFLLLQSDDGDDFGGRLLCISDTSSTSEGIIIRSGIIPRRAAGLIVPSFTVLSSMDLRRAAAVQLALNSGSEEKASKEPLDVSYNIGRCTGFATGFEQRRNLVAWTLEGDSLTQLSSSCTADAIFKLRSCQLPAQHVPVPFRDRPLIRFSEVGVRVPDGVHTPRKKFNLSSKQQILHSGTVAALADAATLYSRPVSAASRIHINAERGWHGSEPAVPQPPADAPRCLMDRPSSSKKKGGCPDWSLHRGSLVTQFAARPASAPPPPSESAARRKLVNAVLQDQWLVVKAKDRFLQVAYGGIMDSPAEQLAHQLDLAQGRHHRQKVMGQEPLLMVRRRQSILSSPTRAPIEESLSLSQERAAEAGSARGRSRKSISRGPEIVSVPTADNTVTGFRTLVYYPDSVSPERFRALSKYETFLEQALHRLGV
jgi:hypothetical protein